MHCLSQYCKLISPIFQLLPRKVLVFSQILLQWSDSTRSLRSLGCSMMLWKANGRQARYYPRHIEYLIANETYLRRSTGLWTKSMSRKKIMGGGGGGGLRNRNQYQAFLLRIRSQICINLAFSVGSMAISRSLWQILDSRGTAKAHFLFASAPPIHVRPRLHFPQRATGTSASSERQVALQPRAGRTPVYTISSRRIRTCYVERARRITWRTPMRLTSRLRYFRGTYLKVCNYQVNTPTYHGNIAINGGISDLRQCGMFTTPPLMVYYRSTVKLERCL